MNSIYPKPQPHCVPGTNHALYAIACPMLFEPTVHYPPPTAIDNCSPQHQNIADLSQQAVGVFAIEQGRTRPLQHLYFGPTSARML